MTQKPRLNAKEAMETITDDIKTMGDMHAQLDRLETDALEDLFIVTMNHHQDSEGRRFRAVVMECISRIFVSRAEAGEVSADHPILLTRRMVHKMADERRAAP